MLSRRFVDTGRTRTPFNPAYRHPSEFPALGIRPGDKIEIESAVNLVAAGKERWGRGQCTRS
jgi:hypothetical protein